MRKFIVLIKQRGEGCDYTIGCGLKWRHLESASVEKAVESAVSWVREHGWRDRECHDVNEAVLIPCEDPINLAPYLDADVAREKREAAERARQDTEAAERALLADLRKRYPDG